MEDDGTDKLEIVYQAGKVGIIAMHGPILVTISLSPEQAEEFAASLVINAREARKPDPSGTPKSGKPRLN